ncbi:hypothetical protein CKF54_07665 [Psittacicella hinzii]|uniref:Uncharacterized protein n=1 Tax=Psittacicella hinzii TaxID=2028575 RepID=A0A3A1Y1J0_9GAMM|nr:hypothetical protein [Psittacicella hinzii]RIY31098.1 hypothetical protein CKF54_07665 [Psittacicella hinzii]
MKLLLTCFFISIFSTNIWANQFQRIVGTNSQLNAATSYNYSAASAIQVLDNQEVRYVALKFNKFDGSQSVILTRDDSQDKATTFNHNFNVISISSSISIEDANTLLEKLGVNYRVALDNESGEKVLLVLNSNVQLLQSNS